MNKTKVPSWLIPAGLILLTLIPVLAGSVRLVTLAAGAPITPENARFHAMPLPVVLHIVGATLFCLVGAFQFAPEFRRKHLAWHRWAGRVLLPAGAVAALSGLWMAFYYPLKEVHQQTEVLLTVRIAVAIFMMASLVLALTSILRRNVAAHKAWIIRAYAMGQGAGTQAVLGLPVILIFGQPDQLVWELGVMTGSWLLNAAVGEYIIWRASRPAQRSSLRAPAASIAGSVPPGP